MKYSLLIIVAVCVSTPVLAQTTTFRDAAGRNVGSATTRGNTTTFRDAAGRNSGSAVTHGNSTTYRDAGGRAIGYSRSR